MSVLVDTAAQMQSVVTREATARKLMKIAENAGEDAGENVKKEIVESKRGLLHQRVIPVVIVMSVARR